MKKIMIAALGLSLLSGTAVFAAQNTSTSTDTTNTMSKKHHSKHKKGSTATDTTSTATK
jgi:hypothetical protein